MNKLQKYFKLAILSVALLLFNIQLIAQSLPHLEKRGEAIQLIVDGEPYIILGGELHNSSSSSMDYLSPKWEQLKAMNLNTVLAAVSWQLVEPAEGTYDFSLVDGLLNSARENDMKLVLLWFGSWKNGLSHYVPGWVKTDLNRFPRIRLENGKSTETITPLCEAARKADAKAFAAFMAYLEKADSEEHTVIMVQIENEVGIIGAPRDYSDEANEQFAENVPKELVKGLKKYKDELQPEMAANRAENGTKNSGSWTDVFGDNFFTEEVFMAWHYARYINDIARAGKAEYDLPMFVNAWIVQPQDVRPGDYPAGGPQAHVHDIWRIGAPDVDLLCPDIYLPDFPGITKLYTHPWNPLFVPESFSGIMGASNVFYALGNRNAIGYSPFGIDSNIENPSDSPLARAYHVLGQITPLVARAQTEGRIIGVSLNREKGLQTIKFGGYTIEASLPRSWRSKEYTADNAYGLIIQTAEDAFIVAGSNLTLVFVPDSPGPAMAGFESIYEGNYINGEWKAGRLLNGDNIMVDYDLAGQAAVNRTGTAVKLQGDPAIIQVKLYRFE